MKHFDSNEEFRQAINRLNALGSEYLGWKFTIARKNHKDEFGIDIKSGEEYLKQSCSTDYLKLSKQSMENLLYCIFTFNQGLEELLDGIVKKRENELIESLNNLD